GRPNLHRDLFARSFNLDPSNPGARILLLDEAANLLVLDQKVREILLVGVPLAQPVHHDAGAEASRSYLLSHNSARLPGPTWADPRAYASFSSATATIMCE